MNKFELTLVVRSESNKFDTNSIDVLVADSMIQLLCQFNILVAIVMRRIYEEEMINSNRMNNNDDIPF